MMGAESIWTGQCRNLHVPRLSSFDSVTEKWTFDGFRIPALRGFTPGACSGVREVTLLVQKPATPGTESFGTKTGLIAWALFCASLFYASMESRRTNRL
jgi:hypothetical protein